MKQNYKTSEFWFTVVSFIFSGFYLLGIIGDFEQKEELISVVSHAVESCILVGGQIVILYRYINARNQQKIEHERTKQQDSAEQELEEYIGVDEDTIININKADVLELIRLPNIGPVTAKKIIKYRKTHGKFKTPEELMSIDGIGESKYKEIKKYITF